MACQVGITLHIFHVFQFVVVFLFCVNLSGDGLVSFKLCVQIEAGEP